MATLYPTATDNGTSLPYPSATNDTNSPSLAGGQDNQNDAIIAVESLVGTNSSQTTPTASGNVLQATSATASEWGLLTSSNVSTSTGTGDFVFATSPTLTSPTINSPTITSPSITGSLGNISTGTITASGLITASNGLTLPTGALFTANGGLTVLQSFTATGLVNYADLLSTIFSGQVQSYTNSGTAGGTGYYINLGGIKLCWGNTNQLSSYNAPNYTVVSPSGFFTTVQSAFVTAYNMAANTQQTSSILYGLGTTISVSFISITNSSTAQQANSWLMIGT